MTSQPIHSTLVLASSSPRRRDLLTRLGLMFEAVAADVNDKAYAG